MTAQDAEIILAFADNNLNVSQTAKAMSYSRSAVVYHLEKIKDETGLEPMNFWNMVNELVPRAERTLTFKAVQENMRKVIEKER